VLEQVGPPAELLRHPANEFVADFLGDDRGIKRLSLLRVDDVALSRGPVVEAIAAPEEARAVMAQHHLDWVGVVQGDRLLGWVDAADLDCARCVGDAPLRRFVAFVRKDTSLKAALDTIVTSQTRVAPVIEGDDTYRGMLTLGDLAEGIT
jgi:osmoprotectant transport system ATP-binding protein